MRICTLVSCLAAFLLSSLAAAAASESGAIASARARAEAAEAGTLAPNSYSAALTALAAYQAAQDKAVPAERLVALEKTAATNFDNAAARATAAAQAFTAAMQRRLAAREAEAVRLAPARWAAAERELGRAAERLERDDAKDATRAGDSAAGLYAEAELEAVKAAILTEARVQVVALGESRADKSAPRTAARARTLLLQADALLSADSGRRDEAARLAGDAAREARHAIALAALVREYRDRNATDEERLLEWEGTLARISTAAGGAGDTATGPRAAGDAVAAEVLALRQAADGTARDLQDRNRQLASQDEEIRELEGRLSGATGETKKLALELQERQRVERQFRDLAALFTRDEGSVLREGDRVIIRLQGLSFASGTASLATGARSAARLMEKAQRAVNIFPDAPVVVEGHTDASGDPAANQRLSQARADAVRAYLSGKLGVAAARVTAVGYGDSRPIANNATSEGRSLNRRIDLVMTIPPPAGGP